MASRKAEFLPADVADFETFEVNTDDDAPETQAESRTESIFSALNDDSEAYINVYREITGYRDKEFVTSVPADKYDLGELLTYLGETFGGGDYRLIGYANKKIAANQLVKVARKVAPKSDDKPSETLGAMEMMRQMMEQNQRVIRELAERSSGAPQKTTMDMLQELALMKEVLGGGNQVDPFKQMGQMFGLMEQMKGLSGASEPVGGDGELGSLMGMVGKLAEAAKFQGQAQQRYTPPQPQLQHNPQMRLPQQPQPRPQPTPEQLQANLMATQQRQQMQQQQPQQKPQEKDDMFMLKMGLASLIESAKEKIDAGEMAEKVLNLLPESQIKEFLMSDNSIQQLAQINGKVLEHKEWFTDLAEHLKAALGMPSKFADLWGEESLEETVANFPNTPPPTSEEMRDAFERGEITDELHNVFDGNLQASELDAIVSQKSSGANNESKLSNDGASVGGSGNAPDVKPNVQTGQPVEDAGTSAGNGPTDS